VRLALAEELASRLTAAGAVQAGLVGVAALAALGLVVGHALQLVVVQDRVEVPERFNQTGFSGQYRSC
jgi:hypothetical protein